MYHKLIFVILIFFITTNCAKKESLNEDIKKIDPYQLYEEGYVFFENGDYFYANKKFSEAELNFIDVDLAAKSAIMSSFSLYGINFYSDAVENLRRYLKNYPADKNVVYAQYLLSIIYFEQISDEKKDLKPLLDAKKQIDFFINTYPETDYAIDLKFKKDLIINQLAAKELFVAKYYISTQKWIPAINRLKKIVDTYDTTIFVEEALHRLVEINYHIGLEDEAKSYAKILGYNYNSSKWYEQSYKVLNKDYKYKKSIIKAKMENKDKNFINKIIDIIK